MKLLVNVVVDVTIYLVIAGVVVILEIIDIFEGNYILNPKKFKHITNPIKKVIIIRIFLYKYRCNIQIKNLSLFYKQKK